MAWQVFLNQVSHEVAVMEGFSGAGGSPSKVAHSCGDKLALAVGKWP